MPQKDPAFVIHEQEPFNAGPPPERLVEDAQTPTELFFVRNHGPIPALNPSEYRLVVHGLVERPLSLSLADLAKLPRQQSAATLQCAGNRRDELLSVAPIPGELPWNSAAIGHAEWEGVALAAVLALAGPLPQAQHVAFLGLDETSRRGTTFPFGGSIDLAKALDPTVLLADTMNAAPLPPVHGWPLRVVVPSYIGARSVKWLAEIHLQAEPSANYFQSEAYRLVPREQPDRESVMLDDLFLSAALCHPSPTSPLVAGPQTLAGYAITGGDATVSRVEVSLNGGSDWQPTEFSSPALIGAWRLWQAPVTLAVGQHEIVVRAFDSAGRSMPADLRDTWNPKGYMNNAWHRVQLTVAS